MAKKIKLNPRNKKGFVQQITRPLEEAHGDTVRLVGKLKNPPGPMKRFPWPDFGGKK